KHRNLFAGIKLHLPIFQPSADTFDISPDGKEICFTADSVKEIGMDFNQDLYAMPVEKPGNPKNLTTDNQANDYNPVYSPDGKSIAFLRQTIKFFYADRARIMQLDRATGKSGEVTSAFDRSCGTPIWSPDGKYFYCEAEDHGQVRVVRKNTYHHEKEDE